MLEAIISYLNSKIESLDNFGKLYGLCEQVNGKPAHYKGNGEFEDVSDHDFYKGVVYHRKIGVDQQEADLPMPRTFYERSYDMKCVAVAPRDLLEDDTAYIDDKIAENIISVITDKNTNTLAGNLKAQNVEVHVTNFTTDKQEVLADEYEEEVKIRHNYIYLAIDFTVTVTASKNCFEAWSCGGQTLPDFNVVKVTDNVAGKTFSFQPGKEYTCEERTISEVWNTLTDAQKESFIRDKGDSEPQRFNGGLSLATRNKLYGIEPIQTGQTVSYNTDDDGQFEFGRLEDFETLVLNNPFGNKSRFTDDQGGQNYTSGLLYDWESRLMLFHFEKAPTGKTFQTILNEAESATSGGYTDWHLINKKQLEKYWPDQGYWPTALQNIGVSTDFILTSTTFEGDSTRYYRLRKRSDGLSTLSFEEKSGLTQSNNDVIHMRFITQSEIDNI